MPKLKTNRGARKRIRKTATGKFVRSHANKSHILTKKTRKRKRNLRKSSVIHESNARQVARLLPN